MAPMWKDAQELNSRWMHHDKLKSAILDKSTLANQEDVFPEIQHN